MSLFFPKISSVLSSKATQIFAFSFFFTLFLYLSGFFVSAPFPFTFSLENQSSVFAVDKLNESLKPSEALKSPETSKTKLKVVNTSLISIRKSESNRLMQLKKVELSKDVRPILCRDEPKQPETLIGQVLLETEKSEFPLELKKISFYLPGTKQLASLQIRLNNVVLSTFTEFPSEPALISLDNSDAKSVDSQTLKKAVLKNGKNLLEFWATPLPDASLDKQLEFGICEIQVTDNIILASASESNDVQNEDIQNQNANVKTVKNKITVLQNSDSSNIDSSTPDPSNTDSSNTNFQNSDAKALKTANTTKIQAENVLFSPEIKTFILSQIRTRIEFAKLIRASGDDRVACYRIPGIVTTNKGTLIAVYDIRHNRSQDLPEDIDVGCSRSFDGGQTWEPMKTIMDIGGRSKLEGVGDPSILVDRKNGRIWVSALWAHNGFSVFNSKGGLKKETSGQWALIYSDDDGATWSEPQSITDKIIGTESHWKICFQGPGGGICLENGTLVFPAQFWTEKGEYYSTLLWSSDQGQTWTIGKGVKNLTCEAQIVELLDGSLMLNMRNHGGKSRLVATTRDLGQTWTEHPTSLEKMLPEPVCQASLIRIAPNPFFAPDINGDWGRQPKDENLRELDSQKLNEHKVKPSDSVKTGLGILAFFNPASKDSRTHMTLRLSSDDGESWGISREIYSPNCFGYSSMTMVDNETIGLLYETTGGLIFQKVLWKDMIPR